jgi:hypothetical protein
MRTIVLLLLTFLLIQNISALCEEGQIDINSASLEELMKIKGLGGKGIIAQRVIDSRPFSSVDSLIDVNGIGNATLNGIKSHGLACVKDELNEEEEKEDKKDTVNNESTTVEQVINNSYVNIPIINNSENKTLELKPISLNLPVENSTKDIKSEENSQDLDKNKIAFYGFFVFAGIIIILLVIRRKKYKNDFE